jgi:Bacterial Ig-like domain (group 3)/Divergent InlB B-repeat domain
VSQSFGSSIKLTAPVKAAPLSEAKSGHEIAPAELSVQAPIMVTAVYAPALPTNVWPSAGTVFGTMNGFYSIAAQQRIPITGGMDVRQQGYFYTNPSYDLTSGTPVTVNVSLLYGGTILQGMVTDSNTGAPLANASVDFSATGVHATTGTDGSYTILATNMPEADASGFTSNSRTASAAGYFDLNDFTSVQISPPFPATRNLKLVPSAGTLVQGTVTDRVTGQPLAGAAVAISGGGTTLTDSNGFYSIAAQQRIPITGGMDVRQQGYFYTNPSYDLTSGTPVTVNVSLLYGGTILQGMVTDSNTGAPLANASVDFSATGVHATTGTDGSYTILATNMPEADASGFTSNSRTASAAGYFDLNDFTSVQISPPFPATRNLKLVPTGMTESVTVATIPSGLSVVVDGSSYVSPQTFTWTPSNVHTIGTTSPQSGSTGTQYAFANWSNGGVQSQTIVVPPSSSSTYTANFANQYVLTTNADPTAGSVTAGGWFNSGDTVSILATANSGYQFTGFSGDLTGVANPQNLLMNGPKTVTASFAPTIVATNTHITAPTMVYGNLAGVTVSVTSSQGTVTGNVSLIVDGAATLTQALSGGSTVFTINGLAVGSHSLNASYSPQNNFGGSSATGTLQVGQAQPTVTFTGAPATAAYHSTFTASASTNASSTATIIASGACAITGKTVTMTSGTGSCSLTANWAADSNYSSASATQSTIATKASPTVTFTGASVSAMYQTTFSVAATTIASTTATITASGVCSISGTTVTITSATGTCSLTASWAADNNYLAASAMQSTAAAKANSLIVIKSNTPNPSVVGQAVTVIFAVSPVAPATSVPTGNVTVNDLTGDACTATVAAGNCTLIATSAGVKTLVATYGGDSNFNPSGSSTPQSVNKANTSANIIGHTPNPSVAGQPVLVNFTVVSVSPGAGTPTGNVTVSDGAGHTCTATVAAVRCSIVLPAAGTATLRANYAGDNNYNGSVSGNVSQNVVDFSISASPSSQSVKAGQKISYKVTVGPLNGFSGSVSLSCASLPPGSTCSFLPMAANLTGTGTVNSTVTVQTSKSTPKGTHSNITFTGVFNGGVPATGGLTHSTSPVSLTVN